MHSTVKVGVIGAGGIAQEAHIPNYQRLDGVEVVAVCDVNRSRAEEVSRRFQIPNIYGSYHEMLAAHTLDAVSVCTHNAEHAGPSIAALQAGSHVLCEKPLAMNVEQGRRMVAAAQQAERILMIGVMNRFASEAKFLHRMVHEGDLGSVYYGKATYLRRRGVPGWGVFHIKQHSGGGPLFDLGVHVLDLTMWLMGSPRPVAVSAVTYQQFGRREDVVTHWPQQWSREEFDVEDFASALVRFDNGAAVSLEVSWAANIAQDQYDVQLMGSKGGARLNPLQYYGERQGCLVDMTPVSMVKVNAHQEEVEHFVACIRGEAAPLITPGQLLDVQHVLDAVYASAEAGKEIQISVD